MPSFLREIFAFMRVRKKFQPLPIMLMKVLLGGLIVLTQSSAAAPFIYSLFQARGFGTPMRMNILHMSMESSVPVVFVLLIPQYLYLINGFAREISGGHVNERETPMEAAQRECLEETGFFYDDFEPLVCFCPGLDNVAKLNSIFYSDSVEERWPFTLDPAETACHGVLPIEGCVTVVPERQIIDCLRVSALSALAASWQDADSRSRS